MYYFSELKDKPVYTDNNDHIGHLDDLIFLASASPKITKLVVHTKLQPRLIIPFSDLLQINKKIIIKSNYQTLILEEDELYLVKNILDKQIIDIKGRKVVRVNDVIIQDKPYFSITGVEVGLRGIVRWFHLEGLVVKFYSFLKLFNIIIEQQVLSWADIQPLELSRGKVVLKKETEKLEQIRPEDLAYYLNKTNTQNVGNLLKLMDDKLAAAVVSELNINYQTDIIRHITIEKATHLLSLVDPDEAVDILLSLSKKRRDLIISSLPEGKQKEINYLMRLSKTPIGQLITSKFITAAPTDNVRTIMERIKKEAIDYSFLHYIYVINENKQLVGVFNLHELLLQEPETLAIKFMVPNVIVVRLTTPEEIAIDKMLKYNIFALPVIDQNKEILGIITFDDIAESVFKKIR